MSRPKPGTFDACKGTLKHSWFLTDVERKSSFGTPVWHMCERCTTVRVTIIDQHGEIAARYYKYPEGYRDERTTRLTTAQYRLMEVSQFRSKQREVRKLKT